MDINMASMNELIDFSNDDDILAQQENDIRQQALAEMMARKSSQMNQQSYDPLNDPEYLKHILSPEQDLSPQVARQAQYTQQLNPNSDDVQNQIALRRILASGGSGSKIPIILPDGSSISTYDEAANKRSADWVNEPYERALKQKELAGHDLQHLTQAQNTLDQQGPRKTQELQRLETIRKMNEEIKNKRDLLDPNSDISKSSKANLYDYINTQIGANSGTGHPALERLTKQLKLLQNSKSYMGMNKAQTEQLAKSIESQVDNARALAGIDVNAKIGGNKIYLASEGMKLKSGKDEQERNDELRKVAIPGFDFFDIKNTLPDQSSAKNVRNSANAAAKIHSTINRIRDLVNQKGLSFQGQAGEGKSLNQYYQDLITQTKELDRLGALSGADIKIETGKIPDPTSFSGYAEGVDKFNERLNNFSNLVLDSVRDIGPVNGYRATPELLNAISSGSIYNMKPRSDSVSNPQITESSKDNKPVDNEKQKTLKWINDNKNQSGQKKYQAIVDLARAKGYLK